MNGTVVALEEYESMVTEIMKTPYNGKFAMWKGVPMKCFEGHTWRNAGWCDRCKWDLADHVWYDKESNTTLCVGCAPQS
jgi:hypothetical protein